MQIKVVPHEEFHLLQLQLQRQHLLLWPEHNPNNKTHTIEQPLGRGPRYAEAQT